MLIGEFLVVANFLEWWLVPTTVGTSLDLRKLIVGFACAISFIISCMIASQQKIYIIMKLEVMQQKMVQ